MKTYKVGGAVRDRILSEKGFPVRVSDTDWVVVGATPEEMVKKGFRPVGADFPVFLHPQTHEEYALARTERKHGRGYKGFVFCASADVTLPEDLLRRDLTINAMAEDDKGVLTDPYGGLEDIEKRVLRHVSPAFEEDPLRVIRTARFAARLPEFSIAPETFRLLQKMVESGETDALVAERLTAEIYSALGQRAPARFFEVLASCGYLRRSFPEWGITEKVLGALRKAASSEFDTCERLAISFMDTAEEAAERTFKKLRLAASDADFVKLFLVLLSEEMFTKPLPQGAAEQAGGAYRLLKRMDAGRRPERFARLLDLAQKVRIVNDAGFWQKAFKAFCGLDAGAVVEEAQRLARERSQKLSGLQIAEVIKEKTIEAIAESLSLPC